MENLARLLAGAVSDYTGASSEDREVNEFAMKILVNSVVDMAVIFGVARLLGVLQPVLFAYVLLATMKYFAGGAHASKMLNCLISGTAVFTCIGLGSRVLAQLPLASAAAGYAIAAVSSLISFWAYAPCVPPQKPLRSVGQRELLRKRSFAVLAVALLMGMVWIIKPYASPVFFWAGCISLVWQSLILMPSSQRLLDKVEQYLF